MLDELEREQVESFWRTLEPSATAHAWLLPYRTRIRRLADAEPAAIQLYLLSCPDRMAPIAIWLLGRCVTRTKHLDLFDFAISAPLPGRRHAARTLRRAEAWTKLTRLAKLNRNDEKIAWYAATPFTKRGFRERLRNFANHVDASHATDAAGPSRMALWFADLDWIRRPPKPVELIRRVLERIHRLVHGA